MNTRIYFDNAATSWPKPECVYAAVDRFQREVGAAAGRGTFSDAISSRKILEQTRGDVAKLFNAPAGSLIVFAFNGTDALNLCLHGSLKAGDHVITTALEHNSVLRPLQYLSASRDVEFDVVPVGSEGIVQPDDVRQAVKSNTRLIAICHASNVLGTLQPIAEISDIAQEADALLLLDAAQTAGHVPIDLSELPINMLACSGHKGLLGPLGTGIVYLAPGLDTSITSFRQGGTGTHSESAHQPEGGVDKFESGNQNMVGVAGLQAGVRHISRHLLEYRSHEVGLANRLVDRLAGIQSVRRYGPRTLQASVGVVSCNVRGFDCHELATLLDVSGSIQVRAGLHCAPLLHESLGTRSSGGTLRISFGPFNTIEQVDRFVEMLENICA